MTPEALIESCSTSNLRGRGGAGFPMGRKASLIDRGSAKPKYLVVNADESEPGAFKDREVMATRAAPADRGLPDRRARDRVQGRLHLHPRRVPGRVRDPRARGRRGTRAPGSSATSRSSCTAAPAPTSAARRRRCSTRSRAGAASRGRGRRSRRCRGSSTRRRRSTTSARSRRCRRSSRSAPAEFAKIGAESSPGTAIFSISGQRRAARQLRARARHADARADLRPRRRDPGRPRAEGGHPGRLVGAGALARPDRRAARLRLARRARHVLRRRLADRRRRPLLHGAARAALDEVLHARVVRQVHAVPRGDALDGADPRAARGRPRDRTPTSTCSRSVGSRILGKSLCALGDFAVYPVASYVAKWRDEFERARRARRLPLRRRVDARGDRRAERRARATAAECTREVPRAVAETVTNRAQTGTTVAGRRIALEGGGVRPHPGWGPVAGGRG